MKDHQLWIWHIDSMIINNDMLDSQVAGDFNSCRLGKWLNSEQGLKNRKEYQKIHRTHSDFHALAQNAVTVMNSGRKEEAQLYLKQMHDLSDQLVEMLKIFIDERDY